MKEMKFEIPADCEVDKIETQDGHYDSNLATKMNVAKDMIYDELLMRLIQELKHNGLIEIKETQEDNESTIFMCINVLKNDFKKAVEN